VTIESHETLLTFSLFPKIDCSKLETKVQNDTFRGLPDANDFSKHKDFYALYLWTYCSGRVADGGSNFVADFCAKPGRKSLHNLYQYWNVWGSQVHKDGTRFYWLEHGPDGLYIAYLVSVAIIVVTVGLAQRALFTSRVTRAMLFLSAVWICPSSGQLPQPPMSPFSSVSH
jgi:hypothetical protein